MNLIDKLYEMLACGNEGAWQDNLVSLALSQGYSQVLFGMLPNKWAPFETVFLRSNYAAEWRKHYDAAKFHRIDPVVAHCLHRAVPLVWDAGSFTGPAQQALYEQAAGFGIRQGVSYPVHGANGEFGMISFVSDTFSSRTFRGEIADHLPHLALIRDFAYESSLKHARFPDPELTPPSLTPRELECLGWAAQGKSSWEISRILGCSEATVNFHFANIRRKFNVATRQQAIVKSIRIGMIQP